ncbi:MAG: hypothetical protein HC893_05100 [Chloroflexaceae bacterium]|nr:hypothetical protein [Chloroflexaceae bacterium]NJL33338.1 hypothetical protein [Chloroflexaceae bacterium]NJO06013.1 hypothetical protein [Chloroflexaceae bacterium]
MEHAPLRRSARDQRYIDCTSFEVYLVVGTVFVLGFSLLFILSVVWHIEPMLWPASVVLIGLCYAILHVLSQRERAAKIREVDGK